MSLMSLIGFGDLFVVVDWMEGCEKFSQDMSVWREPFPLDWVRGYTVDGVTQLGVEVTGELRLEPWFQDSSGAQEL